MNMNFREFPEFDMFIVVYYMPLDPKTVKNEGFKP